jgi:hypothetical protein
MKADTRQLRKWEVQGKVKREGVRGKKQEKTPCLSLLTIS